MTYSNFRFLQKEYPKLAQLGVLAEKNVYQDPSTSLTKLRLLAELISKHIAEYDGLDDLLPLVQKERLDGLKYQDAVPREILDIFHRLRKSGNRGVHTGEATTAEARFMLRSAFKLAKWFYELYDDDLPGLVFQMPVESAFDVELLEQIKAELYETKEELAAYKVKVQRLSSTSIEQKAAKNEKGRRLARKMQETEAETREGIDDQLRLAGWECDTLNLNYKTQKTLPQKGRYMAIAEWKCGRKWADYALFIGTQLVGIIEAKKHAKNVMGDLQQSKMYSELVLAENEATFPTHPNNDRYKVPFLFATNGREYLEAIKTASGIWFWDARIQTNQERPLIKWFSPQNLKEKLAFDEQEGSRNLKATPYDLLQDPNGLNLRNYQVEAIKAVEQKILNHPNERRALLAMATGTGKTRTTIGLCYRLIKSKRFQRILFLVDRTMLGEQAEDAFKEVKIEGLQTFAQIYDLQDLKKAATELDTKIHFATVQSMVHRTTEADVPPSVGEYDCIIVDEAHRGYTLDREMDQEEFLLRKQADFQSKYRKVLDYFDAYRIGLTATPATHTALIFGEAVYNYSFNQAVIDGYLIDFEPPYVFQTRLSENGIVWEKGDEVKVYDPEETSIVELGTTDDEIKVEIQGFNKRVLNESFNRVVLRELISNPEYAINPKDRKKTLIFAARDHHADDIVRILREEYIEMGEEVDHGAITKITGETKDRKNLLKRFKNEQYPSIVVTVDLLTTGIDVPPICNLVFLRRVKSRILYDQMMGRATRKCPEIGKDVFKVYDCVGVTEIMSKEKVMKPVAPSTTKKFVHLSEEIAAIEDEYLKQTKVDRVIAKLQRKLRSFDEEQLEEFQILAKEPSIEDLARKLKATDSDQLAEVFEEYNDLWEFLDREKGRNLGLGILYSEHQDELQDVSRAYSNNLRPKDYLASFNDYIKNNRNELNALQILCTKPGSLTRKDLKEIRVHLNKEGYTSTQLNTAYKETTNEAVLADIIAHIRRAALGTPLIAHEQRIQNAVQKLKDSRQWNTVQIKWLDRIEQQLLQESIITIDDLDQAPFSNEGGLRTLDKVFKNETKSIISELNQYLYG